jgi:signal transduction histidine kinase
LAETRALGEQALREIRTLSYLLHPPMLDQAGLISALRWYVDGFVKRSGIAVDLDDVADVGRLSREAELALFRVVQEALTNVHRHSGSATATVQLRRDEGQVVLRVRDEGGGLPVSEGPTGDDVAAVGVGIAGMRQRLRQLDGRLDLATGPAGTTVTAVVPCREAEEA